MRNIWLTLTCLCMTAEANRQLEAMQQSPVQAPAASSSLAEENQQLHTQIASLEVTPIR